MIKYGFIGLGNMAGAILDGMTVSGNFTNDLILGFNRSPEKTARLVERCGITPGVSALQIAQEAEVIVLGVKPQNLKDLFKDISPAINESKLIISMAAGKPLRFYASALGAEVPVVRVLPNINAKVGASVTALCASSAVTAKQRACATDIFRSIGTVVDMEEALFPAFSAMASSSIAFICKFTGALAAAGAEQGIEPQLALALALNVISGSMKLIEKSGTAASELARQVCSPGGTTIQGVKVLDNGNFEGLIHQAIAAVIKRDREMQEEN